MRTLTYAKRTTKEILRDPLNLAFGIGFPVVLILLLKAISANIPPEASQPGTPGDCFRLLNLAPGITVFGLSFITLFSATLLSKDRGSSLLHRLYTTPLTSRDFIFGYTLPLIPISVMQAIVCYIVAVALGLEITVNIIYAVLLIIPISIFFIALGLLCGSVFTDKQVGGICGALLTNLAAWLSGTWFSLDLVGGVFKKIAYALPFVHAVEMERAALKGNFSDILPHFWWVIGYSVAVVAVAVLCFLRQMKKQ